MANEAEAAAAAQAEWERAEAQAAEFSKLETTNRLIARCSGKLQTAIAERSIINVTREHELLSLYLEDLQLIDSSLFDANQTARYEETLRTANNHLQTAENLISFANINPTPPAHQNHSSGNEHDIVKINWKPIPFYGDQAQWLNFWPLYKVSVHDVDRYSNETKFKCLADCLRGPAKDIFETVQRIPSNYDTIIEMLLKKYSEPNALQAIYIQQLEKLPKGHDEESCRSTFMKIKSTVVNLESLKGITIDKAHIKKLIMQKFPRQLITQAVKQVYEEQQDLGFSINALLMKIENIITIEEYISLNLDEPSNLYDQPSTSTPAITNNNQGKETTALAINSSRKRESSDNSSNNYGKKSSSCIFCEKPHKSCDCRSYPTSQSRRNRLTDLRRCHNCTGAGHDARICKIQRAKCWSCEGQHLTLLCANPSPTPARQRSNTNNKYQGNEIILLQTFTCIVSNTKPTGVKISVRGILDPGSHCSYIAEDLVNELDLTIHQQVVLRCSRFRDTEPVNVISHEVTALLSNDQGTNHILKFYTSPTIVRQPNSENLSFLKQQLPKVNLADNDLFANRKKEIKVLIGTDNYFNIVNPNLSYLIKKGFALLNTSFGYIPTGNYQIDNSVKPTTLGIAEGSTSPNSQKSILTLSNQSKIIDNQTYQPTNDLSRLWDLETIGIESPQKFEITDQVYNQFKETTYIDQEGRYVVRFPWKSEKIKLDSNFLIAKARLKSLINTSSPEMLEKITSYFQDQLKLGIIEPAPPPKSKLITNTDVHHRTHYLPYKAIIQKGKIRVVHDASAKSKSGISFNQAVYPGPNLVESSIILLIQFRLKKIGLVADIEKAFLQISLNSIDRDATRFLWLINPTKPVEPTNLVYLRFARIFFGANASPYLLNMVLKDLLSKSPISPILTRLVHKFYIDDFVHSVNTPAEALSTFNALTKRLSSAKFNLRDWVSNDESVTNAIPSTFQKSWPDDQQRVVSVLGLRWNVNEDNLSCQLNDNLPSICTKHNLLRYLASIYDPLGYWAPCVLDLKVLVQECWKNKYQWHQNLPTPFQTKWEKIRNALEIIPTLSIPRKLWPTTGDDSYSLHVFCDASKKAYACCAYLVRENSITEENPGSLIYAKTRLAPKNLSDKIEHESKSNFQSPADMLSIPRLELMAAIIGKRCAEFLVSNLNLSIDSATLWTDATTVLQWLNSTEVLQPFVQNRINELRKAQNITIQYVSTNQNPADFATRGKTPNSLHDNELWWKGPSWLAYPSLWPSLPPNVQTYTASASIIDTTSLAINSEPISVELSDQLEKRFSSWDRLINVYYYKLKFAYHLLKRPFPISSMEGKRLAEHRLILEIQQKYFFKQRAILEKGGKPLTNLDLFIDEKNLIRCQGRLGHTRFPWEVKHPILLPNKSFAVDLYIYKLHREDHHVGVSHILSKLRERFWVVKGRAKVKSIIHRCIDCRKWHGGSYKLPPMPPVPEIRLNALAAFVHVGADYFGPLHCLNSNKQTIDVQVLLFTCLVTRAIHLELVPDLTGKQCFLALQRFTALRRVPQFIITDNASTFTFIQPMVGNRVKINDFQINRFIDNNKISWHFIPQYAPWFGGAYERLNALVKNSLKRTYGKKLLDYDELRTALTLIADITNSRPLTYVSSDEPIQILTPNHFLKLGPTNINVDIGEPIPSSIQSKTGKDLKTDYDAITGILDGYWDAFRHLYQKSLRETHRAQHPIKKGQATFAPSIGDIVLVGDASPRANWSYGCIERLDHRQATAHVKCKGQIILRSISQLYPLEVARTITNQPLQLTPISNQPAPSTSISNQSAPSTSAATQPIQSTNNQ